MKELLIPWLLGAVVWCSVGGLLGGWYNWRAHTTAVIFPVLVLWPILVIAVIVISPYYFGYALARKAAKATGVRP